MMRRVVCLAVAGMVLLGVAPFASAQTAESFSNVREPAPQPTVIYRLNEEAMYQDGCWGPCLCVRRYGQRIVGTFKLQRQGLNTLPYKYNVTDVNWYVTMRGGEEIRITGEGTYTRMCGLTEWRHRMVLKLSVNGENHVKFDTGEIPGGAEFPDITGLVLSMDGLVCWDRAIWVEASPVPNKQIFCYRLGGDSSYQEGCLPPCLCPMLYHGPLVGGFKLVPLSDESTYREYAIIDVKWSVRPIYGVPPSSTFRGFGRYTRISGIAEWWHRMELDLSIDGGALTPFDSGGLPGGSEYPLIDISLAMNDFYCYDIVLDIFAKRCPCLISEAELTNELPAVVEH